MKKVFLLVFAILMVNTLSHAATWKEKDIQEADTSFLLHPSLDDVVVTGTRNAVDVRYLPMTVTVIGREKLTEQYQLSPLAAGTGVRGIIIPTQYWWDSAINTSVEQASVI